MSNSKLSYQAPKAELLVVRFEDGILFMSGDRNVSDTDGGVSGTDSYYDAYGVL